MADTFVYFIQVKGGGPVKIGCSQDPRNRLVTMMSWSPYPLEIVATAPGDYATEGQLHYQFRAARLHSEWFAPAPELLALMERVKEAGCLDNVVTLRSFNVPAGMRIRCRLFDILAEKGIAPERFVEVLGGDMARVRRWAATTISRHQVVAVLEAFAGLGHPISSHELHEVAPVDSPKSPYRISSPTRASDAGLAACIAELQKGKGSAAPDKVAIVQAVNDLIPTKYWPRAKDIAAATGIPQGKCSRLIASLCDAGLLERASWRAVRFPKRFEAIKGAPVPAATGNEAAA